MSEDQEDAYCNKEKAHPKAVELMTEDLFWDPSDETAPFGSDEGFESYSSWRGWRTDHPKARLIDCFAWILGDQHNLYNEERASDEQIREDLANPSSDPWADGWDMWTLDLTIIATSLSQLLDEGIIDTDAKPYVRVAIKRQRSSEIENPNFHPSETLDAIERVVGLA